ncbi:MAG: hypothetical protein MZW92_21970 [Comamonadaceae bacterium]|nr:hypothetical protein [Comamonadaceae bacterium]
MKLPVGSLGGQHFAGRQVRRRRPFRWHPALVPRGRRHRGAGVFSPSQRARTGSPGCPPATTCHRSTATTTSAGT